MNWEQRMRAHRMPQWWLLQAGMLEVQLRSKKELVQELEHCMMEVCSLVLACDRKAWACCMMVLVCIEALALAYIEV